MEPKISLLLYSKYSDLSTKLLNHINDSQINFYELTKIQTVCIDNEEIRQRIIKNKHLSISSVPCILLILPDDTIEKYEGENVFDWANEILQIENDKIKKINEDEMEKENLRKQIEVQNSKYKNLEMKLQQKEKFFEKQLQEKLQQQIKESNLTLQKNFLRNDDNNDNNNFKNKMSNENINDNIKGVANKKNDNILAKAKLLAKDRELDSNKNINPPYEKQI